MNEQDKFDFHKYDFLDPYFHAPINQYDLKKLFKLTTIVMFLDRSHKQNNNYNESQATYIVNELLDLVKNAYNNEKVINWRN